MDCRAGQRDRRQTAKDAEAHHVNLAQPLPLWGLAAELPGEERWLMATVVTLVDDRVGWLNMIDDQSWIMKVLNDRWLMIKVVSH